MTSEDVGPDDARSAHRKALHAEVRLRRSGSYGFRVRLFDASSEGCKVEFVERLFVGDRVWVKFDSLEGIEATVRWVKGQTAGVQFERPLHEAVFQRLAAAAKKQL